MKWNGLCFISFLFTHFLAFGAGGGTDFGGRSSYAQLQELAFSKKKNYEDRWHAIMEIVDKFPDGAETVLILASQEPEWFMKSAALVGLQKMNSPQRFKISKALLTDKALVVRSQAVEILSQHRDPKTRQLLWAELDHPRNFRNKKSLWIRSQIAEYLATQPLKSERAQFVRLFEDSDKKVKAASRAGLSKIPM
jgi:HEAT repeat protein